MPRQDIERELRRRPFRPFRMHLTDGTSSEVLHPELVLLGRRSLVLGLAASAEETFYERAVDVDLIHIVRMEDIQPRKSRRDGDT